MKNLLSIILCCFAYLDTSSQITVDAGGQFNNCSSDSINLNLGGAIPASNGQPPYTYEWSITPITPFPGSPVTYYASDFLDDTTKANPELIYFFPQFDTIDFYLVVYDSLNSFSSDTANVIFSSYVNSTFNQTYTLNHGDSIYLNDGLNISGGIGSLSYLWKPNHGLKDSTVGSGFWAKPERSINYYVSVTDKLGCTAVGTEFYFIIVNHIGLDENHLEGQVRVFPNPTNHILNISIEELEIKNLSVCNILGEEVYSSNRFKEQIDISILVNGIYILTLETDKGIVRKKVNKE